MATRLQKIKQNLYDYKQSYIINWGLKNGYITPYDEALIEKLRNIYYAGVPASVILLSNFMSNGQCYNRALLMSRAFLDEDGYVQLVCASIDNIRVNPEYSNSDSSLDTEHWFVERVTKDGRHLIYDTSYGFIFDKRVYWLLEHPKVRTIDSKKYIMEFIKSDIYYHHENIEKEKYDPYLILPMIEKNCESPREIYAMTKAKILQREIEHFKKVINYGGVCQEIDVDMEKLGLRK